MKKLIPSLLALLCSVYSFAAETTPRLVWQYSAQSNLYAAPLVGDVHPSPGLESIISDSEVRRLRCVSAQGETLWTFDGKWSKRLISSAALSKVNQAGERLLLIGNGDGRVVCLDAASGKIRWEKSVGSIEWGGVLWVDLDGDGDEEAIVGSRAQGIVALDRSGAIRWQALNDGKTEIPSALAAIDVTGDQRAEIFGVGPSGPFCLNADGTVRWASSLADGFLSAPVLADADRDGDMELFCTSREDNLVRCFDANTGALHWQQSLLAPVEVYAGSGMAVGDITGDGLAEIVVPDAGGHVQAFDHAGELRWIFKTKGNTHCAVTLGDVDGDRQVDVLVASGDHRLYALDNSGELQWSYETGLRLIAPATITDVDANGLTDILLCGSDRQLRCLTLDGAYDPEYIPWPSRRFDAAQTGAAVSSGGDGPSSFFLEQRELLSNGGFEAVKTPVNPQAFTHPEENQATRRKLPQGWTTTQPTADWSLSADKTIAGNTSLHVAGPLQVLSEPVALPDGITTLTARCVGMGATEAPLLRWIGTQGVIREDPLVAQEDTRGTGYALTVTPPFTARWLVLALNTKAGAASWDEASLLATVRTPYDAEVLVNQVGYEQHGPKSFVVQSNFVATTASFTLRNENDEIVYKGALQHQGRMAGYYGKDWGHEYWRGYFSETTQAGNYRIRVSLDTVERDSYAFAIDQDILWKQTAELAYRFFYYQRCGMAIPGFHEACHLDDAVSPDGTEQLSLWGGWHDAGDYNTYHNAPYVYGLVRAYTQAAEDFSAFDRDENGRADFLDEILWGGEHARRMIAPDGSAYGSISSGYGFWCAPELETDNLPGTGDERPIQGKFMENDPGQHQAALARIATLLADKKDWVAAARKSLDWSLAHNKGGATQCSTALDLYVATGEEKYADLAKSLLPKPQASVEVADVLQRFDDVFGTDHAEGLRAPLVARAEAMLALSANPFGVYAYGSPDKPNFFNTPADKGGWHVGTNSYLLEAATLMALAYAHEPDPRYLAFVYEQFNWVLGMNPLGISMMEGAGHRFLPTYHHRYTFGGVKRGAVPGGIPNGVTWRGVGDDRPYLDLSGVDIPAFEPNEVWLPHNTHYLNALVNLRAIESQ